MLDAQVYVIVHKMLLFYYDLIVTIGTTTVHTTTR